MRRSYRTTIYSVIAVFVIAWLVSLELRGLFIPDEGRYAEIAREMLVSGDWITPRLNDLKYFEKPPLQYWLTALSFATFGEDEWTARLPAALLGLGAIGMAGFTARRLRGAPAGILAAIVLGSSWGFYLSGQYLTLDMTLSALLACALYAFLLAQHQDATLKENRYWMLAAWVSAALAVLAKGLIGVVLPGIALIVYSVLTRDLRVWLRLHALSGLSLFLLIALPWFILVQHQNPEFFQFFFINEHFQRFSTNAHSRLGPWWYYVPILLMGLLPWTPAILYYLLRPGTDRRPHQQHHASHFRVESFCIAWTLSVLVFFSVSHSKLPAYIIPAFPAIALLLSYRFASHASLAFKWCGWSVACVGGVFLLGVSQLPHWRKFAVLGPDAVAALPLLYAAALMLLFSGLASVWLIRQKQMAKAIASLAIGSFVFWGLIFTFLHDIDEYFSSERLIERLTSRAQPFYPELPFYSVGQFDHSLPFYLQRPVTLVNVRGELGPGIDAEPHKVIASLDKFRKVWMALDEQAFAVMTPDQFAEFTEVGLPMIEVERDQRLVIVRRFK